LAEACELAAAALLGLGHLHEVHGILHRDVKSPNLILANDRTLLKVGDLGVAVRMDESGQAPPFVQGMHPYIPPETYAGGTIGRSADIYGMGLVLFEMASHPLPYKEYTMDALAGRIEAGRPGPRPRDLRYRPHVPRRLRRVIGKAINKDPGSRYQTTGEMHDDLARVRLIDWRLMSSDERLVIWQGVSVQRPDREYRVEARRHRRGTGWRVAGLQRVSAWRRVVDDVVVRDLDEPAVAGLFESLVTLATTR
jgi:serine/threonine protein kinase